MTQETDFFDHTDSLEPLLLACALKDQPAFEQLYKNSADKIYAVLLRILKHPEWAEEVLQESYMQIWQHADQYHPERGDPLAWMISIARYRAMDFKRKHAASTEDLPSEMTAEEVVATPLSQQSAVHTWLQYCLKQLDELSRHSMLLSYYEGYTHQELSQRLEKPLGTVKSWIRRGLQKLKHCLETHDG